MDLNIVIVETNGSLKKTLFKKFNEETLYKKCNLKKPDDFEKKTKWSVKIDGVKYTVFLFAKEKGRANNENKYDFPPPVDNKLFFGNCILFAKNDDDEYVDLSLELWNKIYEKLFGGFENLDSTAIEDVEEEDELANIPAEMKSKDGYLKDDFIVDEEDEPDEEAEELWKTCTSINPNQVLRFDKHDNFWEMGDTGQAAVTWQQISQAYPDSTSEIEIASEYLVEIGN